MKLIMSFHLELEISCIKIFYTIKFQANTILEKNGRTNTPQRNVILPLQRAVIDRHIIEILAAIIFKNPYLYTYFIDHLKSIRKI